MTYGRSMGERHKGLSEMFSETNRDKKATGFTSQRESILLWLSARRVSVDTVEIVTNAVASRGSDTHCICTDNTPFTKRSKPSAGRPNTCR